MTSNFLVRRGVTWGRRGNSPADPFEVFEEFTVE